MKTVVQVGQGGGLHLHEADGGQGRRQDNEQGHGGGDAGVLDPQDISPKKTF